MTSEVDSEFPAVPSFNRPPKSNAEFPAVKRRGFRILELGDDANIQASREYGMPPRISVVMPVYNARPFLAEAIDSITKQTFQDLEFIIIDDGSTDGSFELSQAAARDDSRIRLIRQSHAGVTAALNRGVIGPAQGEFVARMDADDISLPERFEIQADALDRQPDVLAIGSFVQRIDADGDTIAVSKWPLTHEEIDAGLLRGRGGLAHPTAMIRSGALRAVGGYRQKFAFAQDKDLWLRLAERGRLQNLPTCSGPIPRASTVCERRQTSTTVEGRMRGGARCLPTERCACPR